MKKFLLPLVLLIGLTVFFTTDLKNTLSFSGLAENYGLITDFVMRHQLASWLGFMLLYAAVVALSLPAASLLTLAGGAVLGWIAIPLIIIGASVGACVVSLPPKLFLPASLPSVQPALSRGWKPDLKKMPFPICWLCA